MTTPWIGVLTQDPMLRMRIRRMLEGLCRIEPLQDLVELESVPPPRAPLAVVVELRNVRVEDVTRWAEHARLRDPSPALLLYVALDPPTIWKALELARAQCGQAIVYGVDELEQSILEVVSRSGSVDATMRLLETAGVPLLPLLREIVRYCHTQENCPRHVGELAAGLGASPRTLERRARAEALPAPLTLLTWCKLLRSMQAMEQSASRLLISTRGGFFNYVAFTTKFREYVGESMARVERSAASAAVRTVMARSIREYMHRADSEDGAATATDDVGVPSSGPTG